MAEMRTPEPKITEVRVMAVAVAAVTVAAAVVGEVGVPLARALESKLHIIYVSAVET